jgi:hypothetical protein
LNFIGPGLGEEIDATSSDPKKPKMTRKMTGAVSFEIEVIDFFVF